VHWLGFDWQSGSISHLYQASDYFDFMYRAAEALVQAGLAYVDEQSAEEMRANRGDFTTPGTDSPYRSRTPAENLARLRDMRDGKLADGAAVLRAKIDMASPNINLRDPALYRIKHATHHHTGDRWCIYPMYTYAHPIEDALERITHSICTLEFEDQRPFYDWLLGHLADLGLLARPLPRQIEFARLNMTYTVTSKRKLQSLVQSGAVDGWDDPRMPTLVGLRRRGYTPESIRLFAERIGVSKAHQWVDPSVLEGALRDDLDAKAARAFAVLDPLKLELTNVPADFEEPCVAPIHPHDPDRGQRRFALTREGWIECEDFQAQPPKGFFRLFPGNRVRLKHGVVVGRTGFEADADGRPTKVLATVLPDSRSGTPGADAYTVKGNIHWVSARHGLPAEVRMYDRLFTDPTPDSGDKDWLASLNPEAKRVVRAIVEPTLGSAAADDRFQFERHGYFVADRVDHRPDAPVFNLAVTLKDSWARK